MKIRVRKKTADRLALEKARARVIATARDWSKAYDTEPDYSTLTINSRMDLSAAVFALDQLELELA